MSSVDLDLCYMPATEVLARFADRSLSPVEYLEALIRRAEETEPVVNAFAFTWFDAAMDQARLAEEKYFDAAETLEYFLRSNPGTASTPLARLRLGDARYGLEEFLLAEDQYRQVVSDFETKFEDAVNCSTLSK